MKKICLLFVICYALCAQLVFASGKKDDDATYLDNNWILCVTAFDYSGLSPNRRRTGEVLNKNLVEKMLTVSYRLRLSPEYAYYESYAWQQSLAAAAKALSNKQNERSQLLYRGEANWKYRVNLKKIDADLAKLEEDYRQKEAEKPLINREPVFGLTQANANGTFPEPPQPGGERRFCQSQKSDAILTGQVREFHGRFYIKLGLFTLFTNSWVYNDDIVFSLEDIDGAVNEIAGRLTAALSGNNPASIAITANPPESQILINQSYAGTGTVPMRERPPGTVIIAVGAEGYTSETIETDLAPGETVEVDVSLSPLHYAEVNVIALDNAGASVYHGALYVGTAPYILRLPIDQLNYVTVENWKGERARAVFTSPDMPNDSFDISLRLKKPRAGEQRVNKARRAYYWSWAGVWFTGIAAWLTDGMYKTQNAAVRENNSINGVYDPDLAASAHQMRNISRGALIAFGAAAANNAFWMTRYLYTSSEKAVPIVKKEKRKQ